ncbi:hypothetical protein D3C77_386860 [compost metagenome]
MCFGHLFLRNGACSNETFRIRYIAVLRIIILGHRILEIRRKSLHNERLAICKLEGVSALDRALAAVRLLIGVGFVRSLACEGNRVLEQLSLVVVFAFNRVADEQAALQDSHVRE